jgi:ATP-dependent protease HslVU (ClpYQ) peptidase subunit
MTVILAVPCSEGTVLASDGQGTDTSAGNIGFAIKLPADKLRTLGTHIAWGGTGNSSAAQRLDYSLRQLLAEELARPIAELRGILREAHLVLRQQLVADAQRGGGQVTQVAALYAGYTAGEQWILEITATGEDTVYASPYAVGSGGTFANQAMAAVAHFDLPRRSLAETQVIAWRAIDGCIAGSAFGIGHPIKMVSVTAAGAKPLTTDEDRAVADSVDTWKAIELDGLGQIQPKADDDGLEAPTVLAPAPEPTPD